MLGGQGPQLPPPPALAPAPRHWLFQEAQETRCEAPATFSRPSWGSVLRPEHRVPASQAAGTSPGAAQPLSGAGGLCLPLRAGLDPGLKGTVLRNVFCGKCPPESAQRRLIKVPARPLNHE